MSAPDSTYSLQKWCRISKNLHMEFAFNVEWLYYMRSNYKIFIFFERIVYFKLYTVKTKYSSWSKKDTLLLVKYG